MNPQSPTTRSPPLPQPNNNHDDDNDDDIRDIHALTPPSHPVPPSRQRMFDAISHRSRSSNLSVASDITNSSENFTTMSREFNALVIAGSTIDHNDYSTNNTQVGGNNGYGYGYGNGNGNGNDRNNNINLDRIGEEEGEAEETNPLAIVPDINPLPSPPGRQGNRNDSSLGHHLMGSSSRSTTTNNNSNSNSNSYSNNNSGGEMTIHHVKKEEVETKIAAWQTAKISKINNRFKREDAIISGWENEQVHKATSWMKKVERKLEEKRAKAMEKTQNDIAKARRKAEERRASAEGKRGTKVARVLEVANLMRAVGRPPAKRSFF